MMQLSARSYVVWLSATAFLLFGAVVAANVVIDPSQVFGTGVFPAKTNPNVRYMRYVAYQRSKADVAGLMFASSRGDGIPLNRLSELFGGVRHANFAVPFGLISDHLPVLERVIRDKAARGERLGHVLLLLDIDLFGMRASTNLTPQTRLHPDLTDSDWIRFWAGYLTAVQFRAWRADLRKAWWPSRRTQSGHVPGAEHTARIRLASLGATSLPRSPATRVTRRPDYQRQLSLLRAFVDACAQNNVALTVAVTPLNRAIADTIDAGDRAEVMADIARIVPVWDFGAPAWLSERADFWADVSHFNDEVGRMMLERMFRGAQPDGVEFGGLRSVAAP